VADIRLAAGAEAVDQHCNVAPAAQRLRPCTIVRRYAVAAMHDHDCGKRTGTGWSCQLAVLATANPANMPRVEDGLCVRRRHAEQEQQDNGDGRSNWTADIPVRSSSRR